MDVQITARTPTRQALPFAPGELLRCGLAAAHPFPLVGVRTAAGVRSWRSTPARAWTHPLVQWGQAGSSYAALVLDVDAREAVELTHACSMGAGPVPPANVVMTRRETGHLHAGWILGTPVHRSAAARERPLMLFGRVAEYFTSALGADSGFAGVLAGNPSHADYDTAWPRSEAYELRDLAGCIPERWRVPAVPVSEPGRNCMLFRECTSWGLRIEDDALRAWALHRNRGLSRPLDESEVEGIVASVMRYRARWRARGHKQSFVSRQAARGRASGAARRRGTALEHERQPWIAAGVSRATWYRRGRETEPIQVRGLVGFFGLSRGGRSSSAKAARTGGKG